LRFFSRWQRWMRAGCFERLVEDTRILLREFAGRKGQFTAVCRYALRPRSCLTHFFVGVELVWELPDVSSSRPWTLH
jgi:hypothetical protein